MPIWLVVIYYLCFLTNLLGIFQAHRSVKQCEALAERLAQAEQGMHRTQVRLEQLRRAVDRQEDIAATRAKLAGKKPGKP